MMRITACVAALALLAGCNGSNESATDSSDASETAAAPVPEIIEVEPVVIDYAALLTAADRPEGDAADDAARKPDEVLAFAGVTAGMHVYEIEAGSGYYTELLSHAVGPDGSVIMQNPASFDEFLGDSLDVRLGDNRLANVTLKKHIFDEMVEPAASIDLVTWILGPHELWFVNEEGVALGDPETAFSQIASMLKPGGIFLVVDHAAAAGTPSSSGGDTHRIDPAIIRSMAEAAGLVYVGSSDVLSTPDDDHTLMVFNPEIRRKTDRFVMTFTKPDAD